MATLLYDKLKTENITSDDLKQYVQMSKFSGSLEGLKADEFDRMVNIIIEKLEGGYYHPDMLKDGRVKDGRFGASGETLFGMDRKTGEWERKYPQGVEFFAILDSVDARNKWPHYYMGGSYRPKLQQLATQIIKSEYIKYSKAYLSPESQSIISSDPKLTFNFIYATYNGPGWFQKFASYINNLVSSGTTDTEELNARLIERRKNSSNSLIAQGGRKIEKFINSSIA
jgi:hypothetical protein